jgi:DNA end-binding protein Ku
MRTVLIPAHGKGLTATTLNFDYEVRAAQKAFDDVPDIKIEGEMLELAEHIINTKAGEFDESKFDDRYEAAVAELLPKKKVPVASKPSELLQALRESAGVSAKKAKRTAANADRSPARRKTAKAGSKTRQSASPTRRAS